MLRIIQKRKIWFTLSIVIFALSIFSLLFWQLKFGIDFTGGSMMEVAYNQNRPGIEKIKAAFESQNIKDAEIKTSGDKGIIVRTKTIDEDTHQKVLAELKKDGELTERNFESIGPVIGQEMQTKSIWAIILVLIMILVYITIVFRKVSRPVESWKYGAAAIIALLHDVTFVPGVFAVLGHFYGLEINSAFIVAFLTVLGYSVHDTIVVFDRIRENLLKYDGDFEEIVNKSVNETLVRSINTSVTVILALAAIFVFGGESLHSFSLALILGIAIGTYSSIFLASPILVTWHKFTLKKK